MFDPVIGVEQTPRAALIRMAAGDLDRLLGDIQASTCAVAHAYERLYQASTTAQPSAIRESGKDWIQRDHTIQFNTWGGTTSQPVYQSLQPAYYVYGNSAPGKKRFRQLDLLKQLAPALRVSHDTFDLSWTYLTTADGMMLLYPFLTIDEAVNNDPPTRQVFYTAADFAGRQAGWTRPYLDLAGAGLMVTVSCPAFDGTNGIGVASNDMTLDQLSNRVLDRLASASGEIAYIVDASGLVVGVSDPALRKELVDVNQDAGQAILYYGSVPAGKEGVAAGTHWIDSLTDRLLSEAKAKPVGSVIHVETESRSAWAMTLQHAGWIVVLVSPSG
jgi:hypothetical protein